MVFRSVSQMQERLMADSPMLEKILMLSWSALSSCCLLLGWVLLVAAVVMIGMVGLLTSH